MTIEVLADQFWRDGYLMLNDVFDAKSMDGIDDRIRRHFGVDPPFGHTDEFLRAAQTDVIPWFPQLEGPSPFDALEEHRELRALTTAILGDHWRRSECMVMFSKRGSSGQAWHQDCPPEDPLLHNLNRLVYSSDITEETGGQTVVVPGSHRQGVIPAGDPAGDLDGQVVLYPRKGALVVLHGHVWHRVLPIERASRYSTNYRATPSGAPNDVTDVCVYRNLRYRFSSAEIVERRVP